MSAPVTSPEIGRTIQAGPVSTNVLEFGSGDPVILIHGSGPGVTSYANWRLLMPVLSEHMHVVGYDQVGFGYSDRPVDGKYDLKRWTTHLFDVMDTLAIARAHLVGNSMGAAVAIAAAIEQPQRVSKLVLMGAMGVRFALQPGAGIDAVWGYEPSIPNMDRLIDLFAYDRSKYPADLAEMRYNASMREGVQAAFHDLFPEPRQQGIDGLAPYESRLGEIAAPTLVIHGREDRVIPLETSLRIAADVPDAQLHVFGRSGHWTQLEHAAAFNRIVRDFLLE